MEFFLCVQLIESNVFSIYFAGKKTKFSGSVNYGYHVLYAAEDGLSALALRAHQVGCGWEEVLGKGPPSEKQPGGVATREMGFRKKAGCDS